ncbi:MAG: hypothetical protein WC307_02150 [Candidatus Nanoarchaeia archaeon]|jgi:hypothetical protein
MNLNKKDFLNIFISLLFVLFVLKGFLRPGISAWGDSTYWFRDKMIEYFSLPYLNEYPFLNGGPIGLERFPTYLFQSFLMILLNTGFGFTQKVVYYVGPPLMCTLFGYLLAGKFLKNDYAKIISSITMIVNPFTLGMIIGGQLGLIGGYCFIPAALYFFYKSFDKLKNVIFTGFFISIIGFYDIRILYVTLLGLSLLSILEIFRKRSLKPIKLFLYGLCLFFCFSAFWVIPSLFFRSELPFGYENTGWLKSLSVFDMINHFFLASTSRSGVLFVNYYLFPIFIFISFLSFLNKNKTKASIFFIIFGIFLFLAKGINEPLGHIYTILYQFFPGFSAFRDSTKFYSFAAVVLGLLIGFGTDYLFSFFKKYKKQVFVLTLILLATFSYPYWSGAAGQNLDLLQSEPEDYSLYNQFLINNGTEGKYAFALPQPRRWFSTQKNPDAGFDCYSINGFCNNFLTNFLVNDYDNLAEIYSLLNIKYFFVKNGTSNYTIDYFLNQDFTYLNISNGIFINNHETPLFFSSKNATIIVSSSINLSGLADKTDLLSRAFYLSSDLGAELNNLLPFVDSIIFENSSVNDLLFDSLTDYYLNFNTKEIDIYDFNFYSIYDLGLELIKGVYGSQINLSYNVPTSDAYEVWINVKGISRYLDYPLFVLSASNQSISLNSTPDSGLNWIKIGVLNLTKGINILSLTSLSDLIFDKIAIIKPAELFDYKNQLNSLLANKTVFNSLEDFNLSGERINVSWEKLNPSLYLINMSDNGFLMFADNYDSRWAVDGFVNLRAYNVINSFYINESEITFYDSSQQYIDVGLIISIITLVFLFGLLVKDFKKVIK